MEQKELEMMMIPLAFDELEPQVLARMRLREVHFLWVIQHVMFEACAKCVLHSSLGV